jgi:hypothetical protein
MEISETLDIYPTSQVSDYQHVHAQTTPIIQAQNMRMVHSWVEEHQRSICLKPRYVPLLIHCSPLMIRWTRIPE